MSRTINLRQSNIYIPRKECTVKYEQNNIENKHFFRLDNEDQQEQPQNKQNEQKENLELDQHQKHYESSQQSQISSDEPKKPRKGRGKYHWTERKYQLAKRYFMLMQTKQKNISLTKIAEKLYLSFDKIRKAWDIYQTDPEMKLIQQNLNKNQPNIVMSPQNIMQMKRLEELVEENGLLSTAEMAYIINEEQYNSSIPTGANFVRLTQQRTFSFLKQAGFIHKRVDIQTQNQKRVYNPQNNQKRLSFWKYYSQIIKHDFSVYYYAEVKLGLSSLRKKNFGWARPQKPVKIPKEMQLKGAVVSCLVNPQGIGSWSVRFGPFKKYIFNCLLTNLVKNGGSFNAKQRKMILVDKNALQNRHLFTQLVQQLNFDIINLPNQQILDNPLMKWFTSIKNDLKVKKFQSELDFQRGIFKELDRRQPGELRKYVQMFQQSAEKQIRTQKKQ